MTETPAPVVETPAPIVDAGTITPGAVLGTELQRVTTTNASAQVLGETIERAAVPSAATTVKGAAPAVTAAAVQGAALARTGFGTSTLVLVALGLLLAGFAMVRRSKTAGDLRP